MNPTPATHPRRKYSPEFKSQLITQCQQPGASVVDIALAHDVDASLLRRWIRRQAGSIPQSALALVPIQLESPATVPEMPALRLDIRTKTIQVQVHCPASAAEACARLLRQWLK
jgi:transposase-like protein